MAEQIVHADIRFAGSVGFNKNYSDFPTNPKPQTMIVKDSVPYMYVDLGSGYFSWFPMAYKQFVIDGLALKANTTDVTAAIQAVIDAAPEALNTLREIALEMQADQSAAGALTALVATKASAADLAAEVLARDAAIAAATPSFPDLTSKPTTLAGYGITNAVSTAGAQTIAGSKTFSDVLYLGNDGFMFHSDGMQDTGLSWASNGVFNVKINGSILGQFNSTGWTGEAGTATKLATAVNINGVAFDGSTAITINAVDATARATVTALDLKADQSTTYTKVESDARIQSVVGAAPAALDTLAEIAAQLASDESAAAALVNTVATKASSVDLVAETTRAKAAEALLAAQVLANTANTEVITTYTYDSRASLRSVEVGFALIESLGLFQWVSGSTEPDDDETAFKTATGVWELVATDPDTVFASWLASFDALQANVDDIAAIVTANAAKQLFGSFSMTLTSLAAITSSAFTATVLGAVPGNTVMVTPGNSFGTSTTDQSRLSYTAYVSAANTVTISVRNASAAAASMAASTWSILIIKQ